ncbi:hypothetical protein D3C81_1293650 [compost metagenome]
MHGQFAQAGHQAIDHQADQAVGEQGAAGAGLGDRGTGGHEQPRADGPAEGDHGQVARLELAAQVVVLDDGMLMRMWVRMRGRHQVDTGSLQRQGIPAAS